MMRLLCVLAFVLGALSAGASVSEERLQRIAVVDKSLIATPEARQRLTYLASCALIPEVELVGTLGDQIYRFPGGIGLAPNWAQRPLTKTERRWVSACLLARMNAFGVPVQVSMRAEKPFRGLTAARHERAQFSVHEAGFFGDLFAEEPSAYVCLKRQTDEMKAVQETQNRVCAHEIDPGANSSKCGFKIIGACPLSGAVEVDGETWSEIIHVFLPAQPSSVLRSNHKVF